jgi:aryl-alcohol dehydrogenase-like predicted oxidoreductase
MTQPWADVVLSGAVTAAQVQSNAAAAAISLTDADMACLGRLRRNPAEYWRERREMRWM